MIPLRMLGTDVRVLLVTTTVVWWRLLPRLLAYFLLGYLGFQLALKLAVIAGQVSAWVSLVIFSAGFIAKLAAIVLSLRLVGRELKVRELVPVEEAEDDDRDAGISRLLAVTLLPFLGLYTAFGFVDKAAQQFQIEQLYVSGGALAIGDSVLGKLRVFRDGPAQWILVAAIIVGTYILRRVVDEVHERTGWRPLGIVVAFIEGFFVLAVLIAGGDFVSQVKLWLDDRAISAWWTDVTDAFARLSAAVEAVIPVSLVHVAELVRDQVWPLFRDEITQPLIWLAVAALVFGSKVISLAELWRKGRPIVSRKDRVAVTRAHTVTPGEPTRVARIGREVREAFLGDLDDKYLPTVHSLRLVVRAGFVFLGAYVLVYAVQAALANYWQQLLNVVVGGHVVEFWMAWNPIIDLLQDLPLEPWRLCLLGVAFHRCLEIFQARAQQRGSTSLGPVPPTPEPVPA